MATASQSDENDLPLDIPRRDDIQAALRAVRKACSITSRLQPDYGAGVVTKSDASPVTVADFAAQAVVLRELHAARPEDFLIAEETSASLEDDETLAAKVLEAASQHLKGGLEELKRSIDLGAKWRDGATPTGGERRTWCLDPIDGTKGFLRGVEGQYCVALALIDKAGVAKIGIVACPNLPVSGTDERGCVFVASSGGGCFQLSMKQGMWCKRVGQGHNDKPAPESPSDVKFCVAVEAGFSDPNGWCRGMAVELHGENAIDPITDDIRQVTRIDSQAKYGVIARGDADWYVRLPKSTYREWIWDVAAGLVVLQEAGGRVTDARGQEIVFDAGQARMPERYYGVLGSSTPELHRCLVEAFTKSSSK